MDALLNWLWQGCVVAIALALMLQLLDRTRARVRYGLCWVALFIVLALPLVPLLSMPMPPTAVPLTAAGPLVSVPQVWWTSGAVLLTAWALWAGIGAIRLARAMLALRAAKRHSQVFPSMVERSLLHWTRTRHHGRRAALVVSDRVKAAAVLGGRSPLIAVAPALVRDLDTDELDRVVIHEWAHVQRRDDLANFLQITLRLAAGWHPAVWWIERRLQIEREVACDEMTVWITGSPKSYAACLVRLSSLPLSRHAALPAPGVLMSAGLRGRVVRIVSRRDYASPVWSHGVATVAVVLLGFLSLALGGFQLVEAAVPGNAGLHESRADRASAGRADAPSRNATDSDAVQAYAFAQPRAAVHAGPAVIPAATSAAPSSSGSLHAASQDHDPARAGRIEAAAQAPVASTDIGDVPGHEPLAAVESPPTPPSQSPRSALSLRGALAFRGAPDVPPADVESPAGSPWSTAAVAGVAIGRGSKDAGVATAGFFNRFARRIAGSF